MRTLSESGTVAPDGTSISGTATFDWRNSTAETCRETATFNAARQ